MDIGGATDHPTKPKAVEEDDDDDDEGVILAEVVEGSKHGDGSIFRPDEHPLLHRLYHLHDTRETRLKPMRLSDPTDICHPCWTACKQHIGCDMVQIFSLKLSKLPARTAAGPIQVYGFMAVRDALDPLRNYLFNRSREDPFLIQDVRSDPFVYLSGPKRGIYLQGEALVEYDMRIKKGERIQDDDLLLVDGAATITDLMHNHRALTIRITGDCGARVDIARALLQQSVEATVHVWVTNLGRRHEHARGLGLSITGFLGRIPQEIKMFRGVIGDLCDAKRFVVAVRLKSVLFLCFKGPALGGADPMCNFALRAVAHGCIYRCHELDDSLTVHVKVTWSNLY
ncbi:unnamed protein product [Urochloa decumbens]|uniref:DUF6598 domain-containing protein n=1 Tax=Urochloa decumbens TaxID=240449 RepID=A0ABC8WA13_9POAL